VNLSLSGRNHCVPIDGVELFFGSATAQKALSTRLRWHSDASSGRNTRHKAALRVARYIVTPFPYRSDSVLVARPVCRVDGVGARIGGRHWNSDASTIDPP
jgi:hypothetical protein